MADVQATTIVSIAWHHDPPLLDTNIAHSSHLGVSELAFNTCLLSFNKKQQDSAIHACSLVTKNNSTVQQQTSIEGPEMK